MHLNSTPGVNYVIPGVFRSDPNVIAEAFRKMGARKAARDVIGLAGTLHIGTIGAKAHTFFAPLPALPAWTRCYLCNQPLDPKDAHDVVWSEHRWCADEQNRIDRELEAAYDAQLDREIRDHYAMLDAIEDERNLDWTAVAS